MSNESAKKPAPQNATASDTRHPDAPAGYDVRMQWINIIPKDLTVGGTSLFNRLAARKESSPNGSDIFWSRVDRHYWIGIYNDNKLMSACRLYEGHIGTSQEWNG